MEYPSSTVGDSAGYPVRSKVVAHTKASLMALYRRVKNIWRRRFEQSSMTAKISKVGMAVVMKARILFDSVDSIKRFLRRQSCHEAIAHRPETRVSSIRMQK